MMRNRSACGRAASSSVVANTAVRYTNTDHEVKITIDVPGIKRNDLRVSLDDGALEVSGIRYISTEHGSTSRRFSRTFELDSSLEPGAMTAKHADGVLEVSIPKKEKPSPLEIAIVDGSLEEERQVLAEAAALTARHEDPKDQSAVETQRKAEAKDDVADVTDVSDVHAAANDEDESSQATEKKTNA